MKCLFFFIVLIPNLAQGIGKNVVDALKQLQKPELVQIFEDLKINPKSIPEQTLKNLENALEDPLKLVDINPETGPNLDAVLESDVLRAFFFSRLNLSNEKQMKKLAELLDMEAAFHPSAFRTFSEKTDIESLYKVWTKFMDGLRKEVAAGRIKSRCEIDFQAAMLSVFKTESDMGLPVHQDTDRLRMYELHDNRIVRNPYEQFDLQNTLQEALRPNGNTSANVTPIGRHRTLDTNGVKTLLDKNADLSGYNIKPRILFNLIVWGEDSKPGRYRFLPDLSPEDGVEREMLQTSYQYTEDEVQRLTEIYTNPHFSLDPNHFHWDEIAVPIIQDRANLGTREVVLKAWKDLEWIEQNRWNSRLWSKEGDHDHVIVLKKRILERHLLRTIGDFDYEYGDIFLGKEGSKQLAMDAMSNSDNPFVKALFRAFFENESFGDFFNKTLKKFYGESL